MNDPAATVPGETMRGFCANLSWLYGELPYEDRFEAAAKAGFTGVEVLFPYEEAAGDILTRLRAHELVLVSMNCPPPSYSGKLPGFAAIPDGEERFRQDFRRAMRFVSRFRALHLHVMAGVATGPEARAAFVRNLRWAAAAVPGQSLVIEPINSHDLPGYFLNSFDLAADLLDEIQAPNVRLQFDTYQAQRCHGDALQVWQRHGKRAAHVQVAQVPDRSEPVADGRGGIDFPAFFARLDADGYDGWISAEYRPRTDTASGLGWLTPRAD